MKYAAFLNVTRLPGFNALKKMCNLVYSAALLYLTLRGQANVLILFNIFALSLRYKVERISALKQKKFRRFIVMHTSQLTQLILQGKLP
jgi:hypothetical protein